MNVFQLQVYIHLSVYAGSPSISGDISYSSADQTLTCTSTGGPATTVVWRQNCVIVQKNDSNYMQSQTVRNTQTASYENTLRVVGANATISDGVYTCSVSNSRGSASSSVGIGSELIKEYTMSNYIFYITGINREYFGLYVWM